jgi:hypothetical protein
MQRWDGGWSPAVKHSAVAKRFPCVEAFPDMYCSSSSQGGPGTCSRQWSGVENGRALTCATWIWIWIRGGRGGRGGRPLGGGRKRREAGKAGRLEARNFTRAGPTHAAGAGSSVL